MEKEKKEYERKKERKGVRRAKQRDEKRKKSIGYMYEKRRVKFTIYKQ